MNRKIKKILFAFYIVSLCFFINNNYVIALEYSSYCIDTNNAMDTNFSSMGGKYAYLKISSVVDQYRIVQGQLKDMIYYYKYSGSDLDESNFNEPYERIEISYNYNGVSCTSSVYFYKTHPLTGNEYKGKYVYTNNYHYDDANQRFKCGEKNAQLTYSNYEYYSEELKVEYNKVKKLLNTNVTTVLPQSQLLFCVDKEIELLPAINSEIVWNTSGVIDGNYSFPDKIYAGLGRLVYEYVENKDIRAGGIDTCSNGIYYNIQQLVHKFLKDKLNKTYDVKNSYWIGSNDLDNLNSYKEWDSGNEYINKYKTIYSKALADYHYYNYSNDNIKIYSDNTKKQELVSINASDNTANFYIDIEKPTDINEWYSNTYEVEVLVNGVSKDKINVNAGSLAKITIHPDYLTTNSDSIEFKITAKRMFYLPKEHYRTYTGGNNYQPLIPSTAVSQEKTITKTILATINNEGIVEIQKVKSGSSIMISGVVGVQVYENSGCVAGKELGNIIEFNRKTTLAYPKGSYSVKEINAPDGYIKSNKCYAFNVDTGAKTTVKIENKPANQQQCEQEVLTLYADFNIDNKIKRVELYKIYGYTNLLNFTLKDSDFTVAEDFAKKLCSNATCNKQINGSCLTISTSVPQSEGVNFSSDNWSCYNETIDVNGNTGYCYLSFAFIPNSNIKLQTLDGFQQKFLGNNIKAGQFILSADTYGTGNLGMQCYFATDPNVENYNVGKYNDYIDQINLGTEIIPSEETKTLTIKKQTEKSDIVRGDVNLDGEINNIDAALIVKFLEHTTTLSFESIANADYNGDNIVDIFDASAILSYDAGGASILLGDVNLDGLIDNTDQAQILKYIAGTVPLTGQGLFNADINRDGVIDQKDSKIIGDIDSGEYGSYVPNISNVVGYFGSVTVDYPTNQVYVNAISGKKCDSQDASCVYIGNGLISNFNDVQKTQPVNIGFSVNYGSSFKNIYGYTSSSTYCSYSVQKELITYDKNGNGKLDLEFRIIDTNLPFERDTNSNWCNKLDCSSSNNTVITYIKNRNNSYNVTNEGSMYTNQADNAGIRLTPELIEQIRDYNKTHTYDYYELKCDKNGENCVNAFLSEYGIVKVEN